MYRCGAVFVFIDVSCTTACTVCTTLYFIAIELFLFCLLVSYFLVLALFVTDRELLLVKRTSCELHKMSLMVIAVDLVSFIIACFSVHVRRGSYLMLYYVRDVLVGRTSGDVR